MHSTRLERPPLTPGMKCTGFVLAAAERQEGAGQPGHRRWRGKSRKAQGLHAVPGRFCTDYHQQLLSSLCLPWRGNGRNRTLGHKRVQLDKGRAKEHKTKVSASILRHGSAKVAWSLQTASGRLRGASRGRHVTYAPWGKKSAGTPGRSGRPSPLRTTFGVSNANSLERHQALDLRTLTRF